jgi:hypothetical protein
MLAIVVPKLPIIVAASTVAAVLLVLGAIFGYRKWKDSRITPEERERMRRVWLVRGGKLGDASLVDVRGDLLLYSYDIRGVEYIASQDVSHLHEFLPGDELMSGPVLVRYDARNPANSIVLAETWTGFRFKYPRVAS